MYQDQLHSLSAIKKITPKKVLRGVNFICYAPNAKSVELVGDFNNWDPTAHPMQRRPDGGWFIQVDLPHGHHRYMFRVDGQLQLDPKAHGIARNEKGERVSLIAVS